MKYKDITKEGLYLIKFSRNNTVVPLRIEKGWLDDLVARFIGQDMEYYIDGAHSWREDEVVGPINDYALFNKLQGIMEKIEGEK